MASFENVHQIINRLAELNKDVHQVLQDPYFESLAVSSHHRLEQKLTARGSERIGTVYLGSHLRHARPLDTQREFVHLADDFLTDPPRDIAGNSIFLLLNNDVAKHLPQYIAFYQQHPEVLFVVWDWDSQHWIYMSSILALHSDFYIPATSENVYLLAQFNPHLVGPVFTAVHQWSRKFIVEHMDRFLAPRRDTPLGKHVFYDTYPRRNRAIATVTPVYPDVGFGNNDFKARSDLDNLVEWTQHKTHWIMPVLGGVPIRVFNALVTGGIPLLPAFYKNLPEVALLEDIPMYYEVADLLEPRLVNEAAVARFDAGGESGLIQRIAHAVERHHVDARCEYVFRALEDEMRRIRGRDRGHGLGYIGMHQAPLGDARPAP